MRRSRSAQRTALLPKPTLINAKWISQSGYVPVVVLGARETANGTDAELVGLFYDPADKVALDPDNGVQQAIRHVFLLFARTGSARATVQQFDADNLRTGVDAAAPLAGAAHRAQRPLRRRVRLRPTPRMRRRQRQEDLRHPAP